MKCPNCGTSNGKTNRYCRQCGYRLEATAEQQSAGKERDLDEVALGEELFKVWELYEAGDLDTALAGAEKIVARYPESVSANSLMALVYERKAHIEIEADRVEEARALLRLALRQYERILDLNPGSTADREKVQALRKKLAVPAERIGFGAALRSVPIPYLVATGVFLLLLLIGVIAIPGGSNDGDPRVIGHAPAKLKLPVSNSKSVPEVSSSRRPSSALSIYSFPAAHAPAPIASVHTEEVPMGLASSKSVTAPARVPPVVPNVTVEPLPKPKPKASNGDKGKADVTLVQKKPVEEPRADGATLLARAIELRNQGMNEDAINTAAQAIDLFESDIRAGKNVEYSRRGVESARKLITLWQKSGSEE